MTPVLVFSIRSQLYREGGLSFFEYYISAVPENTIELTYHWHLVQAHVAYLPRHRTQGDSVK